MTGKTSVSLRLGVFALALVFVGGACSNTSEPTGDVDKGPATADALKIIAEDTEFRPALLQAEVGQEVTVEVTNKDDTVHDFAVESLDLNTGTLDANQIATATFTMPGKAVEFVCTYHDGMTGRIEPR
jgi:plastocyanin